MVYSAILDPASRRACVVRGKDAPVRAWPGARDHSGSHAPPGMSSRLLAPRRTKPHCHTLGQCCHGYVSAGCHPRYRRFRCTRARRAPRSSLASETRLRQYITNSFRCASAVAVRRRPRRFCPRIPWTRRKQDPVLRAACRLRRRCMRS